MDAEIWDILMRTEGRRLISRNRMEMSHTEGAAGEDIIRSLMDGKVEEGIRMATGVRTEDIIRTVTVRGAVTVSRKDRGITEERNAGTGGKLFLQLKSWYC